MSFNIDKTELVENILKNFIPTFTNCSNYAEQSNYHHNYFDLGDNGRSGRMFFDAEFPISNFASLNFNREQITLCRKIKSYNKINLNSNEIESLEQNTQLSAEEIALKSMKIAADKCVYTNHNFIIERVKW